MLVEIFLGNMKKRESEEKKDKYRIFKMCSGLVCVREKVEE
jgi:hypothetical protein